MPSLMSRYRPLKQTRVMPGIDPRTWTRYATHEERDLAQRALLDLQENRYTFGLAPAPQPHFDGHKIHVCLTRNPRWYSAYVEAANYQVKRRRVERALRRVALEGRVRGNGYERELLPLLERREHELPRLSVYA